jgi:hypothetical protein
MTSDEFIFFQLIGQIFILLYSEIEVLRHQLLTPTANKISDIS